MSRTNREFGEWMVHFFRRFALEEKEPLSTSKPYQNVKSPSKKNSKSLRLLQLSRNREYVTVILMLSCILDIPDPIKIPVVWFVDDLSAGVEAKDVVSDR